MHSFRTAAVLALTMIATVALAVATAQEPSVDLPADLQRVLDDYEDAWSARDADALAALFDPDGFVLPNGRPPVRGRESIRAHYEGHGGPLSLRAIEYAVGDGIAYVIGGYAPAPGEPDSGKFTLTLRRDADGRWLIVSDMDSPNRRPGG